jgi:hypothetical protein
LHSFPWLGNHGDFSPTSPAAPSLRPLVLSGSLIGCQSAQVYHHHLPPAGASNSSECGKCTFIHCSYSVRSFFFRFRGSRRLHNVLTLIFRVLAEDAAVLFTISSPRVYLKVSLTFPMLSSRRCCLLLRPLIPLLIVLSFLRRSCRIAPRSLTQLLHSGSFRLSSLPPVLSGFFV